MVFLRQIAGRVRIANDMALKMLGLAKEDVIGYYMLGVLNLENEFSLEEIQENSDSFLLDINEEEGIIARVNFSTIVQDRFRDRLHCRIT